MARKMRHFRRAAVSGVLAQFRALAKGFDKKHWPDFADPRFAEENDRYFIDVQVRKEKP